MNPESPYTPGGQQPYQPQQPVQPSYQMPQPPQAPYNPLPPLHAPVVSRRSSKIWIILTFVFLVTTIAATAVAVWAYLNYSDLNQNVESKVSTAVATAVKEQQDKDAEAFDEKEKQPNRLFAGPDDYGRLSFNYPKTWSIYVENDATDGGVYEAYFNPVSVPAVSEKTQYALRVTIETKDYDKVVSSYADLVTKGELKSTSISADGQNGTRLDGAFSEDIKGSAVLFKIRDKTVTMRTDAATFEKDFNALIQSVTFNK